MKYILFSFLFLPFLLPAQAWEITEIGTVPEGVSNNAVVAAKVDNVVWLYSFSGIDNSKAAGGIHGKAWRFNTETGVTETLPDLPGGLGKIAAKANRIGDIIYIIGGYRVLSNGNEITSPAIHRFDINANDYLTDGNPTPVPVDDHVQAVWRDSLIYLITGWSNTTNVPNVQIYTPSTNNWQAATSVPNNNSYKSFGASGTIVGDTIYYFGGASATFPTGNPFPIQSQIRQGIIDPENPTDITWSIMTTPFVGYRTAATQVRGQVFWLGGSEITYNFDGLAYSNNQPVSPSNRSLGYDPETGSLTTEFALSIPMDLQNVGTIDDSIKYIWGGMVEDRLVSNRILKLVRNPLAVGISKPTSLNTRMLEVYPNPANSIISVTLSEDFSGPVRISLIAPSGQVIISDSSTERNRQITLPDGQSGLFFLIATSQNRPIALPFPLLIN